ncbi:MAG: hypothetical protein HFH08_06080 [Bacilli bacterium]|nr:hypothetical protein [Bacilli bacterium]
MKIIFGNHYKISGFLIEVLSSWLKKENAIVNSNGNKSSQSNDNVL